MPQFRIAYRPPYDWDAIMSFLAVRATPGVEQVTGDRHLRTISMHGRCGRLTVEPLAEEAALRLNVDVDLDNSLDLEAIVERVRLMFDVDADPVVIGQALGRDPLLGATLTAHPGIRTPGAWDPFELSVRAILGQQVSVAAATTIAGRVAGRWGTPLDGEPASVLFPTADQLAAAPFEEVGIIRTRAATLRALAGAVRDGRVRYDGASTIDSLRAIPGIGDWTAQYIAMRALKTSDAFPSGDLVLRKMAGDCSARDLDRLSERWRPWRAYAVMLLWQAARDRDAEARTRPPAKRTLRRAGKSLVR